MIKPYIEYGANIPLLVRCSPSENKLSHLMSGLASKWADDDDLVIKAKTQDSHKAKPLESMWADTTPAKPKSPKKHTRNHREEKGKQGKRDDFEELPPMTDGAKALAARIGIPESPVVGKEKEIRETGEKRELRGKETSRGGFKERPRRDSEKSKNFREPHSRDFHSKDHSKDHSKEHFRDSHPKDHPKDSKQGKLSRDDFKPKSRQKDHKFSDTEDLPPMTEGARSLAARLGIVDPPKSETKYLTPKQKRNQNKEETEMLKVKSEIEKIMKEMDNSNSSWADIE